jgi:hypothetical protein
VGGGAHVVNERQQAPLELALLEQPLHVQLRHARDELQPPELHLHLRLGHEVEGERGAHVHPVVVVQLREADGVVREPADDRVALAGCEEELQARVMLGCVRSPERLRLSCLSLLDDARCLSHNAVTKKFTWLIR